VGVVPWIADIGIPDEDAASLTERGHDEAQVEIAVVRLPHLSNFDEFGPLALEPGVRLRYLDAPNALRAPDLVVVPGSKATILDLVWLRERGIASRIRWLAEHGTPVLGVCGGFQMLGHSVRDPLRSESRVECADGVGLLPVVTELGRDKTLRRVSGVGSTDVPGIWGCLAGQPIDGYEIHNGATFADTGDRGLPPLLQLEDRSDGCVCGVIAGTYVHGIFERPEPRKALLSALAAARGFDWVADLNAHGDPYDRLADVIESHLDLSHVRSVPSI
jgi:adenosylcobyric acid synthase